MKVKSYLMKYMYILFINSINIIKSLNNHRDICGEPLTVTVASYMYYS